MIQKSYRGLVFQTPFVMILKKGWALVASPKTNKGGVLVEEAVPTSPIVSPIGPGIRILVLGEVTDGEIMKALARMRVVSPEIVRDPPIVTHGLNEREMLLYIEDRIRNGWFDLVLFSVKNDDGNRAIAYIDIIGLMERRTGII